MIDVANCQQRYKTHQESLKFEDKLRSDVKRKKEYLRACTHTSYGESELSWVCAMDARVYSYICSSWKRALHNCFMYVYCFVTRKLILD